MTGYREEAGYSDGVWWPREMAAESAASLRDQLTIVLTLRKGPRARSGLAKALKDAGNRAVRPGGDDRDVVFALDALERKGYVIGYRGDARGRCRFHLEREPNGDGVAV